MNADIQAVLAVIQDLKRCARSDGEASGFLNRWTPGALVEILHDAARYRWFRQGRWYSIDPDFPFGPELDEGCDASLKEEQNWPVEGQGPKE